MSLIDRFFGLSMKSKVAISTAGAVVAAATGATVGPTAVDTAKNGANSAFDQAGKTLDDSYTNSYEKTLPSVPGSRGEISILQGPWESIMGDAVFTTVDSDPTPSATSVHVIDVTNGTRVSQQTVRSGKKYAVVNTNKLVEDVLYQAVACDRNGKVVSASMTMHANEVPASDIRTLEPTGIVFFAPPSAAPHFVREFNENGTPLKLGEDFQKVPFPDNNSLCR